MSENFDDSPLSDNNSKMDISESGTSISPGISPINNKDYNIAGCDSDMKSSLIEDQLTADATNLKNNMNLKSNFDNKFRNLKLDNDNASSELVLMKSELNQQTDSSLEHELTGNEVLEIIRPQQTMSNSSSFRSSELTLANNSHPLMTPPGTEDSDSEHGATCLYQNQKRNAFSFPDVVPESDSMVSESNKENCLPSVANELLGNRSLTHSTIKISEIIKTDQDINSVTCEKGTKNSSKASLKRKPHIPHYNSIIQHSCSPDLINSSGESEPDLSQYAEVEPNFSSVLLINQKDTRKVPLNEKLMANEFRKIPISSELLTDSDSISNHSFIEGNDEPNLASLSPSSSFDDFGGDFDFNDDDFCDLETPNSNFSQQQQPDEAIPTYSLVEERRDSRNWQKITLPDGKIREIDMRVIEPYKRVLSHGGYLEAAGRGAIVMFCACFLPDRSRADYHYVMDNLFLYVVKTLEQLVTDDYVLIYLHGSTTRRNTPPFPWLKKCYQLLDRRLRKSLKNMYLVHPTFWLKSVVCLSRPFVSTKFWRKLIYVRNLDELYSFVSVEKNSIPERVKNYDAKYK